jgi:predicted nucleic acid-binding protein
LSGLILADTSVIIDFLRADTSTKVRNKSLIEKLIIDDRIIISKVVRLELLMGVRKSEQFYLARLIRSFREIASFPSSEICEEILKKARGSGLTLGLPDLMILSDALEEKAKLATKDKMLERAARTFKISVIEI